MRSSWYALGVIRSFGSKATRELFEQEHSKVFGTVSTAAFRKLQQLDTVRELEFMRVPPGNRLEQLKSNRVGQHCIRVNDQYRICFRWTEFGPEDVEIVDYH